MTLATGKGTTVSDCTLFFPVKASLLIPQVRPDLTDWERLYDVHNYLLRLPPENLPRTTDFGKQLCSFTFLICKM